MQSQNAILKSTPKISKCSQNASQNLGSEIFISKCILKIQSQKPVSLYFKMESQKVLFKFNLKIQTQI